jgi:hypothetical protein
VSAQRIQIRPEERRLFRPEVSMLYSILIYGSEARVAQWTPDESAEVMGRHAALRRDLESQARLGPVLRLTPNTIRTVRRYKDRAYVTDGPFAESKEQLMGLYVVDCATFDEAVAYTQRLEFETCVFEISELTWLTAGGVAPLIPQ